MDLQGKKNLKGIGDLPLIGDRALSTKVFPKEEVWNLRRGSGGLTRTISPLNGKETDCNPGGEAEGRPVRALGKRGINSGELKQRRGC